jgi:ABC-type uncharacterized transport system ATPase subunit
VLILDESTKVLAPPESEGLFRTVAELRGEGLGVVLITHAHAGDTRGQEAPLPLKAAGL